VTVSEISPIPKAMADRFATTFANLVAGIRGAMALVPEHPEVPRWRQKGLPLLTREFEQVQAAMNSYKAGDEEPLRQAASNALSLAKRMDGFPLDFAGEESGKAVSEQRRFVVMAAWQVLHAARTV
jgi:hypothetical protein